MGEALIDVSTTAIDDKPVSPPLTSSDSPSRDDSKDKRIVSFKLADIGEGTEPTHTF